jgi:hypothetical protein
LLSGLRRLGWLLFWLCWLCWLRRLGWSLLWLCRSGWLLLWLCRSGWLGWSLLWLCWLRRLGWLLSGLCWLRRLGRLGRSLLWLRRSGWLLQSLFWLVLPALALLLALVGPPHISGSFLLLFGGSAALCERAPPRLLGLHQLFSRRIVVVLFFAAVFRSIFLRAALSEVINAGHEEYQHNHNCNYRVAVAAEEVYDAARRPVPITCSRLFWISVVRGKIAELGVAVADLRAYSVGVCHLVLLYE